jgi:hypothetical protein
MTSSAWNTILYLKIFFTFVWRMLSFNILESANCARENHFNADSVYGRNYSTSIERNIAQTQCKKDVAT